MPERSGIARDTGTMASMRHRFILLLSAVLTLVMAAAVPFAIYVILDRRGLDIAGTMAIVLLGVVAIDAALAALQGILALRAPRTLRPPGDNYPPAGALVVAEASTPPERVRETVESLLTTKYLLPVRVMLLYETAGQFDAVSDLIAAGEYAGTLSTQAVGSRSRVEAIQDALDEVEGEFIGVFDAGQQPRGDAFTRAWVWLSQGYDAVKGHVAISNGEASWASRLAAVGWETAGSAPCPVTAPTGDLLTWCDGNSYLSRAFARRIARTESPVAAASTLRLAYDRHLLAWQPAPLTLGGLATSQLRRDLAMLRLPATLAIRRLRRSRLSRGRGLAVGVALLWQPLYTWLAPQVPVLVAFWLWQRRGIRVDDRLILLAVLVALYLFAATVVRTIFARILAVPGIRERSGWFMSYAVLSVFFYAGLLHSILRISQLLLIFGGRRQGVAHATRETQARESAGPMDTRLAVGMLPAIVATPPESQIEEARILAEALRPPTYDQQASVSPWSNGDAGEDAVTAAHRLNDVVARLIQEIDEQEEECRELRTRVEALEAQLRAQAPVRRALRELSRSTIGREELATVESLVQALRQDPSHIVVLASVSQHAETLSRVVEAYVLVQDAVTESVPGT